MKNLQYDELKLQKYLASGKLNTTQKRLLFKIRTRMVMTPENLGRTQLCKLCNCERDDMSHVLACVILKLSCQDLVSGPAVSISDAYGEDEDKMKTLAIIYQKAWKTRERLLKKLSMGGQWL